MTILSCGVVRPPGHLVDPEIKRERLVKEAADFWPCSYSGFHGHRRQAADGASKDDAVAMVKQAVAFIKDQGPEKAYPEITNKAGKFIDRDLYVVVYQLDGKVLAHGSNEKFVGKDLSDAQDVDGKLYVKERVELASKQPSFWQDYKFVNPVSKKVEPKQMYCEKLDNTAVCAGIYKS
jgi:cytochrome c